LVRVRVLNRKNRVRTIFLRGKRLPKLDLSKNWTIQDLAEVLKWYPGIEFARWSKEFKGFSLWRPLTQLKGVLNK